MAQKKWWQKQKYSSDPFKRKKGTGPDQSTRAGNPDIPIRTKRR